MDVFIRQMQFSLIDKRVAAEVAVQCAGKEREGKGGKSID